MSSDFVAKSHNKFKEIKIREKVSPKLIGYFKRETGEGLKYGRSLKYVRSGSPAPMSI